MLGIRGKISGLHGAERGGGTEAQCLKEKHQETMLSSLAELVNVVNSSIGSAPGSEKP